LNHLNSKMAFLDISERYNSYYKLIEFYQSGSTIYGNYMLTEILIQNLLKNAFTHNVKNGHISVTLNAQSLTMANAGNKSSLNNAKNFNRFCKKSDNPDALGLGLAIALKIAEVSGWELRLFA